ncbi:uncharacterized protein LOC107461289 [Arachis duranensis]|uniref:Uncharacterized protein LOC107461289 n=1 Tax=Arachis duranensis TaxID=130453 RepID=A0A6P4B7T0_ARADU|nr:uncharacterized protein LOC107461289 [Arachis duranensis]
MTNTPSTSHLTELPELPDEIIWQILVRCEPKTASRCKVLNSVWNQSISSPEFAKQSTTHNAHNNAIIVLQFGYPNFIQPINWISMLYAESGVPLDAQLPIQGPHIFDWSIIGSDKGLIAINYSTDGVGSDFLIWNPLTGAQRHIADPFGRDIQMDTNNFGFTYDLDSQAYYICHVYKNTNIDHELNWRVYNSIDDLWEDGSLDQHSIQKLGPTTLMYKGHAVWINWVGPSFNTPHSIVMFSLKYRTIERFRIPSIAKNQLNYITLFRGYLCYVSYATGLPNSSLMLWKVNPEEGSIGLWERHLQIRGISIGDKPDLFLGNNVLLLHEHSGNLMRANDRKTTEVVLTTLNIYTEELKHIFYRHWHEEVHLDSLIVHNHGLLTP